MPSDGVLLVCCCRLVQPCDRILLVSCSYDHNAPGADVLKEYTDMAGALKVRWTGLGSRYSNVLFAPCTTPAAPGAQPLLT